MKTKIKILLFIIIGLLGLGIGGVVIQKTYAYYSRHDYLNVLDEASTIGCNVYKTEDYDIWGYRTINFVIDNGSYESDELVPYNYTLTIENADGHDNGLFGQNNVFDDHVTINGTMPATANASVSHVVQLRTVSGNRYGVFYKYTVTCKQVY